MRKLDVSEVLKAVGNELEVEEEAVLSFPEDDLNLLEPVKVKVKLVNTGRTVLLRGKIETAAELTCCRCLKKFKAPIVIEIEEEYSRSVPEIPEGVEEVELSEEHFIFPISPDNTIDLGETIRQNLLINLPLKPLCSKGCKGLDQGSGKGGKQLDPRWAKLKELKKGKS